MTRQRNSSSTRGICNLYSKQTKPFDLNDFANAVVEALDPKGFAEAFLSPPDLRKAGTSLLSQLRRPLQFLLQQTNISNNTFNIDSDPELVETAKWIQILAQWRNSLERDTVESIERQLPYLLNDEFVDEDYHLSLSSFTTILNYLAERRWIKVPALTLTRNGIFVGNWRPARDEKARLSIDFIDNRRVRWSAVDIRDAEAPAMIGGLCPISELDAHLRFYRDWLRR